MGRLKWGKTLIFLQIVCKDVVNIFNRTICFVFLRIFAKDMFALDAHPQSISNGYLARFWQILPESCKIMHNLARFLPESCKITINPARNLQDNHFSARNLQDKHFSARILQYNHFSARILQDSNFSARILQDSNFSARILQDNHFSVRIL